MSISTANTARPRAQDQFALLVKTRLLIKGITVTDLAETLGLARNTVSIAINHPTMLPTVKQRIREELKLARS